VLYTGMRTFFVLLKDKGTAPLENALLLAHVAHIKRLHAEGRLLICGPLDDNSRALQIITAQARGDAERIVQADPFIEKKVYRSYELHELIEGNEKNNWLLDP
jgi:uncharacterized protein YciI